MLAVSATATCGGFCGGVCCNTSSKQLVGSNAQSAVGVQYNAGQVQQVYAQQGQHAAAATVAQAGAYYVQPSPVQVQAAPVQSMQPVQVLATPVQGLGAKLL